MLVTGLNDQAYTDQTPFSESVFIYASDQTDQSPVFTELVYT